MTRGLGNVCDNQARLNTVTVDYEGQQMTLSGVIGGGGASAYCQAAREKFSQEK